MTTPDATAKAGALKVRYQSEITAPMNGPSRTDYRIYTESGKFSHLATCKDEANARLIVESVNSAPSLRARVEELAQAALALCRKIPHGHSEERVKLENLAKAALSKQVKHE